MNTLDQPAVRTVLARLHEAARSDPARWEERRRQQALSPPAPGPDPLVRMGNLYLAVGEDDGRLLHVLARAARARRIVEFGASFGVSTLYLAAAAEHTDGQVITTEAHPQKCAALRSNLADAGLAHRVELLEGDARETLRSVKGPIDLLVLDGWKSQYLPVFELLRPALRPGALVAADNINHPAAAAYADRVDTGPGLITQRVGELALTVVA